MSCVVCDLVGQDGSTPLLAAVAGSHDSIVKALLAVHANVNAATKVRESSGRGSWEQRRADGAVGCAV